MNWHALDSNYRDLINPQPKSNEEINVKNSVNWSHPPWTEADLTTRRAANMTKRVTGWCPKWNFIGLYEVYSQRSPVLCLFLFSRKKLVTLSFWWFRHFSILHFWSCSGEKLNSNGQPKTMAGHQIKSFWSVWKMGIKVLVRASLKCCQWVWKYYFSQSLLFGINQ